MLARFGFAFLVLAVAPFALGASYGPIISDVGCQQYEVMMPNPNLYPNVDGRFYYVYSFTDVSHGFSSGEFYTNSPSKFMTLADNLGYVYWVIESGSQWSPPVGTLFVNITLYSNSGRSAAARIGSGNFTSTDLFLRNFTDPLSPHGWVYAVGGNVTLSYDIIPSAVKSPAAGFSTTVFQSRTVNLHFPPNKNMWTDKETFTNRFFSRSDVPGRFVAPFFDTTGNEKFWNSNTKMVPFTANYDNYIQMWGSNGYDIATNTYPTTNVGIDMGMALTCSGFPPVIHVVPPPCPRVVPCTTCATTPATVSGVCGGAASAHTQSTCLTLTTDDNLVCNSATSNVQV